MRWSSNRRAVAVAAGASLLLGALIVYGVVRGQTKSLQIYGDAPPFKLTDHLDRPVSSDEFRGRVIVANFVYTKCPDICPLLSLRMQALQERLREEKMLDTRVQLLSFTTDPARDTPAVLRAYAERHRADPSAWRFLTGPEAEVKPLIVKGFLLGVQKVPARETGVVAGQPEHQQGEQHEDPYEVMHSTRFALIDREGRIRAYYDGRELDLDQVVRDIRQLLR